MKYLLLILLLVITIEVFPQTEKCNDILKVETYSIDLRDSSNSLFSEFKSDSLVFNNFFNFVIHLINNNYIENYNYDNFFEGSDYLEKKIKEKKVLVSEVEVIQNQYKIGYLFIHEVKNSKYTERKSIICIEALTFDFEYVFSIYLNTIKPFLLNSEYLNYFENKLYTTTKFNELLCFSEISDFQINKYPQIDYDKVKKVQYNWVKVDKSDTSNFDIFYPETVFFGYFNLIDLILYGIHKGGLTPFHDNNKDITKDIWILTEE